MAKEPSPLTLVFEEQYVRFVVLNPDGRVSDVKQIRASDMARCPHTIFASEHYRFDGTCKCNDENEIVMREWGYEWKEGQWR